MRKRELGGHGFLIYLWNVFCAAIGSGMMVGILVTSIWPILQLLRPEYAHTSRNTILFFPFFPLQTLLAVPFGFLNAKKWQSNNLYWTWIPPAIAFFWTAYDWGGPPYVWFDHWKEFIAHFFGRACTIPYCYDQLSLMPLFSALGFTLGVLLQRKAHFGSGGEKTK